MTENLDLVATRQALPETETVATEGIQFAKNRTCQAQCIGITANLVQTVCAVVASCR